MLGDIISGLCKCYLSKSEKSKDGNFKSSIMKKCGLKKALTLIFMLTIDVILSYFGYSKLVIGCYAYYYVVETFSVIENLNLCGVKIPKIFENFIKSKDDEEK